jgi:hypothetical protein
MASQHYHLAQFNIGKLKAPLHDSSLADFVAQLATINAIADQTPGFVWRLQDEGGDATSVRLYADEHIIVNFSIWESIEALFQFVYRSQHGAVMGDRRRWFIPATQPNLCLWWIAAGTIPTLQEAKHRLEYLREHGSTPYAFSFKAAFPSPADTQAE